MTEDYKGEQPVEVPTTAPATVMPIEPIPQLIDPNRGADQSQTAY